MASKSKNKTAKSLATSTSTEINKDGATTGQYGSYEYGKMPTYTSPYKDTTDGLLDQISSYGDYTQNKNISNLQEQISNYGDYTQNKNISNLQEQISNYGNYESSYDPDKYKNAYQNYGDYEGKYDTDIAKWLNKLLNQSYDADTDPTYQQYKNQYISGGRSAMTDTMAQAQALNGGYGSSYAQSAGQQAYNSYMQDLANKIPELAQAARDMYSTNLSTLQGLDDTDYSRWRDGKNDAYTNWQMEQSADESAYGRWQDSRDELYNQLGMWQDQDNTDYSRWQDSRDELYNQLGMWQDQDSTDYSRWQDGRNELYNQYNLYNDADNTNYSRWEDEYGNYLTNYEINNPDTGTTTSGGGGTGTSTDTDTDSDFDIWGEVKNELDSGTSYDEVRQMVAQIAQETGNNTLLQQFDQQFKSYNPSYTQQQQQQQQKNINTATNKETVKNNTSQNRVVDITNVTSFDDALYWAQTQIGNGQSYSYVMANLNKYYPGAAYTFQQWYKQLS